MSDTLKEVANALVGHCRAGTEAQGLKELYAPDAVSIEATVMPGMESAETHGVEGIQGKHDWWAANFEVHNGSVSDPMFHGDDRFSVIFELEATNKASGERSEMKEIAIYTINGGGKISREEFFYQTG